jgi:hypothetical protein
MAGEQADDVLAQAVEVVGEQQVVEPADGLLWPAGPARPSGLEQASLRRR